MRASLSNDPGCTGAWNLWKNPSLLVPETHRPVFRPTDQDTVAGEVVLVDDGIVNRQILEKFTI